VNESGVDVTFTTNAGNDSITIDDTYYDSNPEVFTISYDLETPINQGFDPVGTYVDQANAEFTGSLDGKEYDISGLNIKRQSENYVGLFGLIGEGGEVKNVGVINVNMTGDYKVGSLAGINYGEISNSNTDGAITGGGNVGGLFGENDNGTISNSYSTGNVTGVNEVGGLVGDNHNGNISNSYSTGNVTGVNEVGGLVGENWNNGTVSNSYSTGNVSSDNTVGGLVGANRRGSVSDSYWDINSTVQSSSDGGNGLTTSEMQGSSAEGNMNFDFTDTWSTVEGDYPELQWQE
jgi:hypothetical protein